MDVMISSSHPTGLQQSNRRKAGDFYQRRMRSIVDKNRRNGATWTSWSDTEKKHMIRQRSESLRSMRDLPKYQKLSGTAKHLLARLVESVQEGSHVWQVTARGEQSMAYGCWCGVEWMMRETGRSRRAVQHTLRQLTTAGFLARRRTRKQAITYVFIPLAGNALDVTTPAHPLDVQLSAHRMTHTSSEKYLKEPESGSKRSTCDGVTITHARRGTPDTPETQEARKRIATILTQLGVKLSRKAMNMTQALSTGEATEWEMRRSIDVFTYAANERRNERVSVIAWILKRDQQNDGCWWLPMLECEHDEQQSTDDAWLYAVHSRMSDGDFILTD